ncbi:MAG: TIGR03621 family F420-dependent LLM class oxidoreductase [Actinobacteria bacterium]|nr:TIGR03621 family F420-dependent LLM class oxidoreductase [Actinomycetota bacterium]
MRDFRFSYGTFGITSREKFVAECREAEEYGYDTIFAADHLGIPAPFPVLVAAAEATRRMRVGTLVLNAAFWNPALLAREIITTDIMTDGRLEVGLGSGHMKWEFDEAGIGWQGPTGRAAALERLIGELQRFFSTDFAQLRAGEASPKPVQRAGFGGYGPPLLVGGTGDSVLRIGAQHAQVVGMAGAYQVRGQPPGTLRLATAAEVDERMAFAVACAGQRASEIEWHLLVQRVVITDDRRAAAEEIVAESRRRFEAIGVTDPKAMLTAETALETPLLLIGTADEIAAQLRRSRERWGYSYVTVHGPYMRTFAPVIDRLRNG